jgi:hypothetical protein
MKTLKTFVMTMTAMAFLGSTGLYAQTKAVANIPFAFTILDKTMPAGQYTIQATSLSMKGTIRFQNVANGHSAAVLAPSNSASYTTHEKNAQAKVIFHRYGDRYFFSEVWTADGLLTGKAMPSKLERETRLSSSGNEKQMASVSIPVSVGQ